MRESTDLRLRAAHGMLLLWRTSIALDRIIFWLEMSPSTKSLAIDAPAVDLKRLRDGALELAQPLFESAPVTAVRRQEQGPVGAASASTSAAPDKPWSVTVAKTTLTRGNGLLTRR